MSPTPDLRRLTHFIAVAESAGFTSAAKQLHLSQQALSHSVQQLEKEIGAALLIRSGRHVMLTPAGQTLMDEGRALLAAATTLTAHTRAAASAQPDVFVVGHSPAISNHDVYALIEPAIAAAPHTSFTVMQLFPERLTAGVRDGVVQLGLRRAVVPQDHLAGAVIGYEPLRVALPAQHRLAARAPIGIADLADDVIALWAPPGASYYSDFLINACRRAGFEPHYRVSRVQGCPPEVAALTESAAAFVTAPAGPALNGAVMIVDLDEPLLVPIQALWQPHTSSAVRDLILRRRP
ncbi:LysR family transcriptional regulator [Mycolicibacter arupensis]|jgi:DNA-binding transcriptional LysR family regulator|uniref:Probable hydrogen peroxide-inducible genes activator n=1 Tax=Mycolicibacter arupensis TaxID=342002 RepID=A0A0F5N0Q9_9MYCO|nr:LysR family transcriptional regulator [Mycolicibacter arupensis]KKC00644.1 transcriptional regulator [Mycolicibacter arupensis]MCV7276776.1 LysR family transcriptional regulator [Mycolicibacter arupensis]OQZ96836.1 LysR family transcriptional regulator [Mycolicibacter arupensis]TXI51788.1 MAG: LysR family transcriptional regulator [Mycolicibacter arupensis]